MMVFKEGLWIGEKLSRNWSVNRITGRDCKTDFDDERMEKSAARTLIDRVVQNHGIGRR